MNQPVNKTLKVLNVSDSEKSVKVTLIDPDDQFADSMTAYASKSKGFSRDDFTIDDEQKASLTWVPDKNDPTRGFYSLQSWGEKSGQQKQFGGGGKSWQPKSAGDVASIPSCTLATASASLVGTLVTMGAIKTTKDALDALESVHTKLTDLSVNAIGKLKGAVA